MASGMNYGSGHGLCSGWHNLNHGAWRLGLLQDWKGGELWRDLCGLGHSPWRPKASGMGYDGLGGMAYRLGAWHIAWGQGPRPGGRAQGLHGGMAYRLSPGSMAYRLGAWPIAWGHGLWPIQYTMGVQQPESELQPLFAKPGRQGGLTAEGTDFGL